MLVLAALLAISVQDTSRAAVAGAFADSGAAGLVARARAARQHIERYRDRPSRVEVKGARQGVPIAIRGEQVPEDLDDQVRWLVIDPSEDYLRVIGAADSEGFVYPLIVGGEASYRFRAGDTTTITL